MPYDYTNVSVESVEREADEALSDADALIAQAAAARTASVASGAVPTWNGVMRPLDLAWARSADAYARGAFLGQVHTDAAVRDAGSAAEERFTKWRVGLAFRRDLYEAVKGYAATDEAGALTGERKRLLEKWLRDFRRAGQELPDETRQELERLRTRLVELEVAYQRNINEVRDGIDVTDEQLEGMPEAFVERLEPGTRPGTRRVTVATPDLIPFLEQSPDREGRRELFEKDWSKAGDVNRPLLAEALRIRQRMATLLGFATWAHYALEVKMAAHPDRVRAFYDEIVPAVRAATRHELAEMARVAERHGQAGDIGPWDWRWVDFLQRAEAFGEDPSVVNEYLPLDEVLDGLFAITGEVFGLRYRLVEEALAWHPSVQLYEIHDIASDRLLAWVYLDLFPREGKFNHAEAVPLVLGHVRADGGGSDSAGADGAYERPVTAILANVTPPGGGRPSLLRHLEVQTLFHEFGHVLHMSLTTAESARFSGADTEWDFVEAPSQIMQHWIWNADVLARFARHYQTGDPIPRSLVERLTRARVLNSGLRTGFQVFYGTMDLALHGDQAEPDLDEVTRATYEVTQLAYPEGTFLLGSFGHLMGGYDAGYYGYLWAEALGDDMWSRFETEGVTSPEVGGAFRRDVLEPNGARAADEMFRDFVGREPSTDAWMRLKGFSAP